MLERHIDSRGVVALAKAWVVLVGMGRTDSRQRQWAAIADSFWDPVNWADDLPLVLVPCRGYR